MFEQFRIIHFVGIGGIGMSGIAEVLHNLGYDVTGSDIRESETTRRLREIGIKVMIGHKPENIVGAHVVVISSAVSPENPEVVEARKRAIPVIPRAEMLAELGRLKYGILVAGAHGKTTTTSLIATVLGHAGIDPTVVIGGKLRATGSNARLGQGDFIVAEADESDGSFLKLSPTIAVVTNIDREHMDFFRDMDNLKEAFLSFVNKVPFYGLSILCLENRHIRDILPRIHRRFLTYGFSEEADVRAINIRKGPLSITFDVIYRGDNIGSFYVPIPGSHNVLNCLAAISVAKELHIEPETIREALEGFKGIQRRFEFKGEARNIKIFDDYGHHPEEIRNTLRAARDSFRDAKIIVIFQPHRYTRTRDLLQEFSLSFSEADILYVLDIYAAGENQIEGVNSAHLVEKINKEMQRVFAHYRPDKEKLLSELVKSLRQGDIVLTLGAGDVWKIGEELLSCIRATEKQGMKAGGFRTEDRIIRGCPREDFLSLPNFRGDLYLKEGMSAHTTLRIGGEADIYAQPSDVLSLKEILFYLKQRDVPLMPLGGGSNILVSDRGFRGAVISTLSLKRIEIIEKTIEGVRLFVEAGASLQSLLNISKEKGFVGLEGLAGIPGTLGGAIKGNAGAFGMEIGDVTESVTVMDLMGNILTVDRKELGFGYRESRISHSLILSAIIRLKRDDPLEVTKRINSFLQEKREKQPIRSWSAGCVFKNPKGEKAGRLIDEAGCKGMRRGDIEVSRKHANFFVNRGKGRAADFLLLMDDVKTKVFNHFGIELEPEIRMIGF